MTREELAAALRKADAAGNTEDARRLAGAIRQLDAGMSARPIQSAEPAPMPQPDATPWGDGQAFDDMYARKPQTDPTLSPLRPEARTLTAGQPMRMKPPPAPRGPLMTPMQRNAMAQERAAAEAERRAAQERREASRAYGAGMDMVITTDAQGQMRPGTEVDRDIGAGITTLPVRAVNAASNTAQAVINLPGDIAQTAMGGERVIPRADIPEIPLPQELKSVTGDLSQSIMQFLMARGLIGKTAPGGGNLANAGKDAAALFAGFDSDTPRMTETLAADFMRQNGMGWMADRDPNNPLMERVKNGIEEMVLAYAPVEVARRTPQVVDTLTGVRQAPLTPTNAGGATLRQPAPQMPPVAPATAATQPQQPPVAPTAPPTVTAPPVPPTPPNAPAVTAGAPQPGQVPPAGVMTPVPTLGPAEQAFNNLPMKTRESMLNAFQSAGVEPARAKAMIGELNNLPDGQNTMYALEIMRRNGLTDADIDGVLIAMGREFATESPRPAGRVFNREQDSARQIMNDQVRTQINSEGRSITDVAERNFGPGVVPAGEALDLELDQLSNAYETILSTKRSPTGRLRSPAKKDAVYKAREDLTNALVSPEVMQTIPQDVKLQIMMQASDDMRRLKFTPDELGLILQGDGAVLAPLFNGYGALSWSPELWSHLARQYPTQAAHSLQSALRKAADEAFRRGDATAARYYKRLRGESGKGGLLDMLERAVPKYKETRIRFGDASSAKEALDILERFKAAAASEGDVAKIIKDLEDLPQRHREMAEQQITSIVRQELARKVESPRLAELGQTVAQTPNLTSLSRQDFLKALEDVFGPRGKELADAIRASRARTDTLTSISPKYNSRTEVNRQDVQNAPALYEAPGSLEGGIIDQGVKRLGTVAGGAALIPGGQGAAIALGAATAVQAALNAARRGKRLSNAERNELVNFLFKSRTAGDAAPPVATRGPSAGDYAQAIGRDAAIGAGVGAVADGDPLNNDPMTLFGGAVGGAVGYGRARLRNARSLIKPPPAPRGAGRRNPPPAGPRVQPPPAAPRNLRGQAASRSGGSRPVQAGFAPSAAPGLAGAGVGGAMGYMAPADSEDERLRNAFTSAAATGLGAQYLAGKVRGGKGGAGAKAPPAGRFRAPDQQTFAGVNAKTADKAALARAQNMEAEGASRDAIWDATGWFKGVDGKWRFEIDDSGAKIGPAAMKELTAGGDYGASQRMLGGALRHQQLYDAYPQLRNTEADIRVNEKFSRPNGAWVADNEGMRGGRNLARVETNSLEDARSILLHEAAGHGVQDIEGFARGGSMNDVAASLAERKYLDLARQSEEILSRPEVVAAQKRFDELKAKWQGRSDIPPDIVDELRAIQSMPEKRELARIKADANSMLRKSETWGPDALFTKDELFDGYRRLAGEAEARNVQTRDAMRMRGEKPGRPWETQDVPDEQQIVRFGGGKAESRPKPPPRAQGFGAGGKKSTAKPMRDGAGRVLAGGAIGGIAGGLAGEANAQEDLSAEINSTKKEIDDLNAALKTWDSLDVKGKQKLLIDLGRVQSTYLNAKGQRVRFDDGTTGDRTEPLFKAYAEEKRSALQKAEAALEDLKKQNAYRQYQKEQNPFLDAVRELGPSGAGILAGVAAGVLRYRAVGKSAKAAKVIEDDINDLLTNGPVKGLMKKGGADNKLRNRAVNMKDFYRKGGAAEDDLPFKYGPQGWKANPKPAKPGSLYTPKTTTKMDGVGSQFLRPNDIKIIGAGVLDSAMVRPFVADAEEELKKAQEDVENGNESIEALRRVEKAKTNLAMYQAIERIGWGVAGAGALSMAYRYKLPKPDIRGAEDEVTAIADYLKSKAPPRTPRTPKALPPPPAPPQPPVAGPSPQLLLPLLPPAPPPKKPKPKPKKS